MVWEGKLGVEELKLRFERSRGGGATKIEQLRTRGERGSIF